MLKANHHRGALLVCALLALVFGAMSGQQAEPSPAADLSPQQRAALGIKRLQSWYDPATGLYRTTGWWNSANAVTTLADYSHATGDTTYEGVFPEVLTVAQHTHGGFLNDYYDDEGWWALAWIDVYDLTHEQKYLEMTAAIFADMTTGWDDTCSGGIWWSKERKYKNAIANELFLSVAARLAARTSEEGRKAQYLNWAEREWRWFAHSGMINSSHQVNDGLDAKCANNHQTTWTYNQGVILGGLAALFGDTHDQALLSEANAIAAATLSNVTLVDVHGILHEPCEPHCGADGTQFKGIFVRNLAQLYRLAPKVSYREFVVRNAGSIWSGMRNPEHGIAEEWAPPFGGGANASTQNSGLDALVAAIELENQ